MCNTWCPLSRLINIAGECTVKFYPHTRRTSIQSNSRFLLWNITFVGMGSICAWQWQRCLMMSFILCSSEHCKTLPLRMHSAGIHTVGTCSYYYIPTFVDCQCMDHCTIAITELLLALVGVWTTRRQKGAMCDWFAKIWGPHVWHAREELGEGE